MGPTKSWTSPRGFLCSDWCQQQEGGPTQKDPLFSTSGQRLLLATWLHSEKGPHVKYYFLTQNLIPKISPDSTLLQNRDLHGLLGPTLPRGPYGEWYTWLCLSFWSFQVLLADLSNCWSFYRFWVSIPLCPCYLSSTISN